MCDNIDKELAYICLALLKNTNRETVQYVENLVTAKHRRMRGFKKCRKCIRSQCIVCRGIGPSYEDLERIKHEGLHGCEDDNEFMIKFGQTVS